MLRLRIMSDRVALTLFVLLCDGEDVHVPSIYRRQYSLLIGRWLTQYDQLISTGTWYEVVA